MAVNETPPFWFEKPGLKAWALSPLAWVYGRAAARAMNASPSGSVPVPVLCIGNFVTGGGGKTPTALAVGQTAIEMGFKPGYLSRGYGGKVNKPTIVDPEKHNALDVGDEPLLLCELAITVVTPDRIAGANMLAEQGCDFIIMDDGFQNPRLARDFNLVVVDARRGIGNGFAMPAGPLRLGLRTQLLKTDAVLIVGEGDGAASVIRRAAKSAKPIFMASLKSVDAGRWKDKAIIPFAGIADPTKFFDGLRKAGARISQAQPFGDHHYFRDDEIDELVNRAKLMGATLVTTAKDMARLRNMGKRQLELAEMAEVSEVTLAFEDDATPKRIISRVIKQFEKRNLEK